MSFTTGEMLFYGGIAGMCLTLAAAIIVSIVLAGSRKRLRRIMNEEYGNTGKR